MFFLQDLVHGTNLARGPQQCKYNIKHRNVINRICDLQVFLNCDIFMCRPHTEGIDSLSDDYRLSCPEKNIVIIYKAWIAVLNTWSKMVSWI